MLVCDSVYHKGYNLLNIEENIEVIDASHVPKDKLLDMLKDADVGITRSSTEIDEKFSDSAKNMKAIVRSGVGVDL